MRQGQQNKRMRGRGRKGPSPMTRSYESNGGDVKIRGTALHVAEKYVQLSRDAHSAGDRVAAENYMQHAEHYYRILAAAQAQLPQPQPIIRSDDGGDEDDREGHENGSDSDRQPLYQGGQQGYGQADPQPYVNGNDHDQSGGDGGMATEPGGGRDRGNQPGGQPGGHPGGFRRRRPFRERYGERSSADQGDQGNRTDDAGSSQSDD